MLGVAAGGHMPAITDEEEYKIILYSASYHIVVVVVVAHCWVHNLVAVVAALVAVAEVVTVTGKYNIMKK